jgi:hydrogenase small subunit
MMGPMVTQDIENRSIAPIKELDILWITAGLGCDGDTIAMTAARQPSIEDIVLGAIPGIPKVNFHNPVLASESAEDFMRHFHLAAEGRKANPIPARYRGIYSE